MAALRTHRDRAMVAAMVLGGLRRCEVLGLRLEDLRVAERRVFIAEGKGGRQRLIPVSGRFFAAVAAYLDAERPPGAGTDRVFVVLKGPRRGQPLTAKGMDVVLAAARRRAGLDHATCHELRHTCLTRLREAGMALEAVQAQAGHASIESTRIYLHLADDWLAAQYRKAAEVIDAQVFAAQPAVPAPPGAGDERPAAGRQRDGRAAGLGRAGGRRPPGRRHDAPLPDPDRLRAAAGQRRRRGPGAALLRRVPGPGRARGDQHRAGHPPPYRGLQALAGGPARAEQAAADPGHHHPRLGTLRMFFIRIDEWGWDEAPPRVPMFTGDLPRTDHPLPKALDDASAARLLRAAQNDKRLLVRVTVEMLLRTGLRVSEYTSLRADAVVQIGAGPWLHVPVGKLREDRYLPLHPQLIALIDDYRARMSTRPTRCCCRGRTASRRTGTP